MDKQIDGWICIYLFYVSIFFITLVISNAVHCEVCKTQNKEIYLVVFYVIKAVAQTAVYATTF